MSRESRVGQPPHDQDTVDRVTRAVGRVRAFLRELRDDVADWPESASVVTVERDRRHRQHLENEAARAAGRVARCATECRRCSKPMLLSHTVEEAPHCGCTTTEKAGIEAALDPGCICRGLARVLANCTDDELQPFIVQAAGDLSFGNLMAPTVHGQVVVVPAPAKVDQLIHGVLLQARPNAPLYEAAEAAVRVRATLDRGLSVVMIFDGQPLPVSADATALWLFEEYQAQQARRRASEAERG